MGRGSLNKNIQNIELIEKQAQIEVEKAKYSIRIKNRKFKHSKIFLRSF